MEIKPVILSGGSGTRLWPLSRKLYPKQLLPLVTEQTLLQETVQRIAGINDVSDSVIVVCNEEHRFLVAEQLREIDMPSESILLEPEGRNTAPALCLSAFAMHDKEQLMLVMPADHVIENKEAFATAVSHGATLAADGYVVTFGIVPDCAETGFGYIQKGTAISGNADSDSFKINCFVEKPDTKTAEGYLKSGEYLWNSGMFMVSAKTWLSLIKTLQPEMYSACETAYNSGQADCDFYRVDKDAFLSCPNDSIDYAVMERLLDTKDGKAAVVPLSAGWSDVGAWSALWEIGDKDSDGNILRGDALSINSKNSLLLSEGRFIAGVGLNDLIVVETADAVLVADRNQVQDVKAVVEWLKGQKREEHLMHRRVTRPWGCYEGIDVGERFQVKRITVNPGASLSLQLHHHRAEHWIVVNGTAKVTRGEEVFLVSENESTYIPIGTKHRLDNPGAIPLEMIEVQSGSYLGEDDIVRFEDIYGRSDNKNNDKDE